MLHIAAAALASAPQISEMPPTIGPAEIVVTARQGELQEQPDAVAVLQEFCFDPLRRERAFAEPVVQSRWIVLDDASRVKFDAFDSAVKAFSLFDSAREQELWLKIERVAREDRLIEDRCTVLVIGGSDHDRFRGELSRLFRGAPTRKHIGHPAGTPGLEHWDQWLWTGMPERGSDAWRAGSVGRAAPSFTVVTDPRFYRDYDYIYGDLKVRKRGAALTQMSFGLVYKSKP